jgi:hypothetical protein
VVSSQVRSLPNWPWAGWPPNSSANASASTRTPCACFRACRCGSFPNGVPIDPTIYRFYEIVQVYGSTLKALVHEEFGDGIMSGINFKVTFDKVEDPEGGHRASHHAGRQIPADQALLTPTGAVARRRRLYSSKGSFNDCSCPAVHTRDGDR